MSQKIREDTLVNFAENDTIQKGIPVLENYKTVFKNWGKEIWIVNNVEYCMKFLYLDKGKMCSIHYHKEKDETFHIMDGFLKIELWHGVNIVDFNQYKPDHVMNLWPGSSIRIVRGTAHRFTGIKNVQFIEVSTPHKDEDSYRLVPSPQY